MTTLRERPTSATEALTSTRRTDWLRATVTAAESLRTRLMDSEPLTVRARRTIAAPPDVVYDRWWGLAMPAFTTSVDAATGRSPGGPQGPSHVTGLVDRDVEVLEDVPGELVTWRSVGAAPSLTLGRVDLRPAPGNRGTEVRVQVTVARPVAALRLFQRDERREQHLRGALRRFASIVECGSVIDVAGQTHGRRSRPQAALHKVVTAIVPGGQG